MPHLVEKKGMCYVTRSRENRTSAFGSSKWKAISATQQDQLVGLCIKHHDFIIFSEDNLFCMKIWSLFVFVNYFLRNIVQFVENSGLNQLQILKQYSKHDFQRSKIPTSKGFFVCFFFSSSDLFRDSTLQ